MTQATVVSMRTRGSGAAGGDSTDPVTAYARAVVDGTTIAGRLVRLQCERHLRDLEEGPARGLRFDLDKASRAFTFFGFLKHYKGEWTGRQFKLRPWQEFIIGSLFGWQREYGLCATCESWAVVNPDSGQINCATPECDLLPQTPVETSWLRRFRVAYVAVPRKNGKTLLAAGLGLLLAFFDGEGGAECYAAATKREQAKICWLDARTMALASPDIKRRLTILTNNLNRPDNNSKFEPLGADVDGMDGLNIHGVIVDELHAHKTRSMWDVLQTATGARRQPLTFAITTAGFGRNSICYEQHDYSVKILEQLIDDDTFFTYVAQADEGDDWREPLTWQKANPNYGISVKVDDLERKCFKAQHMPSEQNNFLRLHLNRWTESDVRWLDMATYDENTKPPPSDEDLKGRKCWVGVDLSSTEDLTVAEMFFPDFENGGGDWKHLYFVPEENIHKRSLDDRVPYDVWRDQGLIIATPGNVVDYDYIREALNQLREDGFEIQEVGYDPYNATQWVTDMMQDDFVCVPVRQTMAVLAAPTKEFQKLLMEKKFRLGPNPVTRWAAANVSVELDAAGNMKPTKAHLHERDRIDPIVGMIIALDRASRYMPDDEEAGFFFA